MAASHRSPRQIQARSSPISWKNLPYEQLTVSAFLDLAGLQDHMVLRRHFETVELDQKANWNRFTSGGVNLTLHIRRPVQ